MWPSGANRGLMLTLAVECYCKHRYISLLR
jgi:hypothetical protein